MGFSNRIHKNQKNIKEMKKKIKEKKKEIWNKYLEKNHQSSLGNHQPRLPRGNHQHPTWKITNSSSSLVKLEELQLQKEEESNLASKFYSKIH